MWNGKCHMQTSPSFIHQRSSSLSIVHQPHHHSQPQQHYQPHSHQPDITSLRSVSSEDVSGAAKGKCCSAAARNPAIKTGRRIQLFQMIILPFIPILALIVQTSVILHNLLIYRMEVSDIETQVTIATDLGKVVTRLQLERSEVAFYVFTNGSHTRSNLTQRFAITDQALNNMTTWSEVSVPSHDDEDIGVMLNRTEFLSRLNDFRDKISSEESSIAEVMNWYTSITRGMLNHLTEQIKETDNSGVWRYLLGFKNLLRSIECIGIATSYGIKYFGRGVLGTEAYVAYIKHDSLGKDLLNGTLNYVPSLFDIYRNLNLSKADYGNLKNWSNIILKNRKKSPSVEDSIDYYDLMAKYVDELRKLQRELRIKIRCLVIRFAKKLFLYYLH
ncbi:unnamed protein product [Hermetia illucens]|uniref:Nitrate/nitrite sensing protein domain-containing protein n=1 Tax=Hermetia illucens TaxID=343691 RepID=A0A7R8V082_HERIL|nr:unnamed protein product [Hermetia illucens]